MRRPIASFNDMRRYTLLVTTLAWSPIMQKSAQGASTEHLIFRADCQLVSDPFPVVSPAKFEDFWSQESTRNLLLSAGGQRNCRAIEPCTHTHGLWVQACHETYGLDHLPSKQNPNSMDPDYLGAESIMATDTDAKFPGFRIHNTVLNGCKLHDDREGRPAYTFCLIGDHKAVQGNPSITWLVKKLTGMSSKIQDDDFCFGASETTAKTQIRIVPAGGLGSPRHDHYTMKMEMNVEFATHIRFPKSFLSILPASKEKVEQKGSRSIHKVVEKDAKDALDAVREAWLSAVESDDIMGEDNGDVPIQIPVRERIRAFKQRFSRHRA